MPTTTAHPTAKPQPAGVATCADRRLQVAMPHVSAGVGGYQTAFLEFRDAGTTPCVLSGYPTITLLDSARDPMPQTQTDDPVYPVATVTLQPGTPPITPGRPSPGHAYATLRFSPYEGPHGLCDSSAQVLHPSYLTVDGQVISATSADGHPVQSCAGAIQVTAFGSLRTVSTG